MLRYGARSKAALTATTVQNRHGQRNLAPSYQQPTRASKIRASPRKAPGQVRSDKMNCIEACGLCISIFEVRNVLYEQKPSISKNTYVGHNAV